jgi:non-specific serine/threonine protein kinase/serine/threonine-protein kinase
MNTLRWERTKQILEEALHLAPERRPPYLASACGEDGGLRAEVESLIASYEAADSQFLATAAPEVLKITSSADRSEAPSLKVIGHYRLEEEIGRGGMGQVWRAEQTEPVRRQVALKLIKVGMYDDEVLMRFQSERQSLAMMDHPAIAKVFDAGATPDGQPYFVMEYVPGVPITDYCDRKRLNIRDRLELFIKVCEGVQHAHQKAIIHRDLKPANILAQEIDGKPVPRIIDFGLAKATAPRIAGESLYTRVGSFVGTPGYMSPEQCDPLKEDVDTRSDVYSLGVVLYVLLTGCLPFDNKAGKERPIEEMLRVVREEDPPPPSTKVSPDSETATATAAARGTEPKQLVSLLRGDMDWVTMKAIEKDRGRRYGSATELAADIRRYLNYEPVMARPASISYRLRKYLRRHRIGVGVAAGLVILLAGFAAMQAMQLRRITRERDRADRIAEFMTGIFKVSDPSERIGNSVTAREVLDKASKDIDTGLSMDPELQARMMFVMGMAYLNLGLYPRAESLFGRSGQVASAAGLKNRETLKTMQKLAWALYNEGRFAEAESQQSKLIDIEQRVLGPDDHDTIGVLGDLATTLSEEGHLAEAEKMQREVLERQMRILGPEAYFTLVSMNNLAVILFHEGRFSEADKLEREAIEIKLRVAGPENLSTIHYMMTEASLKADMGELDEAEKSLRQLLELERRVLAPNQPEIAVTVYELAAVAAKRGRAEEALSLLQQAIDIGLRPVEAVQMEKDPDLNALHGDPRFAALVAHAKERAAAQK